jgi:hypothetical protein
MVSNLFFGFFLPKLFERLSINTTNFFIINFYNFFFKMSEFEEIISDNEISEAEQSTTAIATKPFSKKRTSKVYSFYTFGDDDRWHCKNCRQVFFIIFVILIF